MKVWIVQAGDCYDDGAPYTVTVFDNAEAAVDLQDQYVDRPYEFAAIRGPYKVHSDPIQADPEDRWWAEGDDEE